MKAENQIAKDWRGCSITIGILVALFIGGPFLAWGNSEPSVRMVAGHALFALIGAFIIALVLDSYLAVVAPGWIRRGLFGRHPMKWDEIDRVEAGLGVTFFSGQRKITIYPFVFKNEKEFLALVDDKLKGRFTFSTRSV